MELEVGSWIGRGSEGHAFEATDELGRDLVVKFFDMSMSHQEQWALEHARVLARVDHPAVVRVVSLEEQVFPDDGKPRPAIVLLRIPGTTLDERLRADPRVTTQEALLWGGMIIDGVAAMHAAGVCHSDIHVGNIIVNNERAVLIDPLYKDSLALVGSKTRRASLDDDLWSLVGVLRHLVEASASESVARDFSHIADGIRTDPSALRRLLERTLEQDHRPGPPTATQYATISGSDAYAYAKQLIRDSDEIGWRDLLKARRGALQTELAQWQSGRAKPRVVEMSQLPPLLEELVDLTAPHVAIAAAAIECGSPSLARTTQLLRTILENPRWQRGGQVVTAELTHALVYVFHHTLGATAVDVGSHEFLARLALSELRLDDGPRRPLVHLRRITGWPSSLGSAQQAWDFVLGLPSKQSWISDVFGDHTRFEDAVAGYQMCLGFMELVSIRESGQLRAHLDNLPDVTLDVPPVWLSLPPQTRERAFEVAFPSTAAVRALCGGNLLTEEEVRLHWPTWVEVQMRVAGAQRRDPFMRDEVSKYELP